MSRLSKISYSNAYPESLDIGAGGFALYSPAKINIGLRVIGRRADGFHEIETLFQEISLSDRLDFYPDREWHLESSCSSLPLGESNLVEKAANLLSDFSGKPCSGRVILHKNIPIGGGLGGGSSNAAVALFGLNRLWRLNLSNPVLQQLAAELGSDCSFFINGGLVHGSGRGEILFPLSGCLPGVVLLIVPDFAISTPWAYSESKFPLTDESKSVIFQFRFKNQSCFSESSGLIYNDLENIVLSRHPELGQVKQKLLDFGAKWSLLSGSGSVVYGFFLDFARAWNAAQRFGRPFQIHICRAVSRR